MLLTGTGVRRRWGVGLRDTYGHWLVLFYWPGVANRCDRVEDGNMTDDNLGSSLLEHIALQPICYLGSFFFMTQGLR